MTKKKPEWIGLGDVDLIRERIERVQQMFIDIRDVMIYVINHDADIRKSGVSVILEMVAEKANNGLGKLEEIKGLLIEGVKKAEEEREEEE